MSSTKTTKPTVASLQARITELETHNAGLVAHNNQLQARNAELEAQVVANTTVKTGRTKATPEMQKARRAFTKQQTAKILETAPETDKAEQKKQVDAAWNALTDEQKLAFNTAKPVKEKKTKDSDAPKKPLSGYMLFAQQKRGEIKAENPDWKFTDISRELGIRWKSLSSLEQEAYKVAPVAADAE